MRKIVKQTAFSIIAFIGKKNISAFLKFISKRTRKMAAAAHKAQLRFDWQVPPTPEWFDHYCDQFYQFHELKSSYWVERGTFGIFAMDPGASVLELCCGDGFNSNHFYSGRAATVIAVDFDETAINHAKKFNKVDNVEFRLGDIRYNMPEGTFDNIIWDAAIEHFTEEEIANIMSNIKTRLKPGGILAGYTLLERPDGQLSLVHHEREFRSKEDLRQFFEPHFKNIKVFETIHPSRHNLYFYASDGILPFDADWKHSSILKK